MKRVLAIILLLAFGCASASENLEREDYKGVWKSNYTAVKGESQSLNIDLEIESVFERRFEDGKSHALQTEKFKIVDDVLILEFNSPDGVYGYKLALSGWKLNTRKTLYGSMFMYRNGLQFNMLPVSFVIDE
jgi:hypothetical protein